jgi:hypothetical protein
MSYSPPSLSLSLALSALSLSRVGVGGGWVGVGWFVFVEAGPGRILDRGDQERRIRRQSNALLEGIGVVSASLDTTRQRPSEGNSRTQ